MTRPVIDVAIIGAGPYGLSIAAHLRVRKVTFRIFGTPMSSWRNHMAAGTYLKSFGFASDLYDPGSSFTLAHFCQERGLPYSAVVDPVSLETFVAYGLEFQKRFVPDLEQTDVTSLEQSDGGFALTLQTGERLQARRVVVAAGITHFGYTPPLLASLPKEVVTHSSEHTDLSKFSGRRVAVIGAGASAADLAGLLHEAGADAHLIARRNAINFHEPPEVEPRRFSQRVMQPRSGLGQGWRARISSDLPLVFHAMPVKFRLLAVQKVNGPAPGWFAKDKVIGRVTMHLGTEVKEINVRDNGVHLQLNQGTGKEKKLEVDHVIAATGYKVKLQKLGFFHEDLLRQMNSIEDTPVLNTNFESSVPGLYMVGLASSNSFGPLCRFAFGAKFTSARIARHLAATSDVKGKKI